MRPLARFWFDALLGSRLVSFSDFAFDCCDLTLEKLTWCGLGSNAWEPCGGGSHQHNFCSTLGLRPVLFSDFAFDWDFTLKKLTWYGLGSDAFNRMGDKHKKEDINKPNALLLIPLLLQQNILICITNSHCH
jgi:hypothetical protein